MCVTPPAGVDKYRDHAEINTRRSSTLFKTSIYGTSGGENCTASYERRGR